MAAQQMRNEKIKPTVDLDMEPNDRLIVERVMDALFGLSTPHRAIYRVVFVLIACPIVFFMSIYRLLLGPLIVIQCLFAFVIFPVKVCIWLYHHGIEAFKLAFWFFVWFFVFIWIISKYVSINDVFVINIHGVWIYGVTLLPFLYAYFKYARWEWRAYCKNRMDYEISVITYVASKLYEEKEYDALVRYCEEEILKHPNCSHIIYWLARGKYKQGRLEASLDLFERIETMCPDKSYPALYPYDVAIYVKKVKQAIIERDEEIKQAIIKRDKAQSLRRNFMM